MNPSWNHVLYTVKIHISNYDTFMSLNIFNSKYNSNLFNHSIIFESIPNISDFDE